MMLHQDGSRAAWLVGQPQLDLIAAMDDATSKVYSAFLVEEEGTISSFLGLAETIGRHGLFGALYTDRGGHYFITRKGESTIDKKELRSTDGRKLERLLN